MDGWLLAIQRRLRIRTARARREKDAIEALDVAFCKDRSIHSYFTHIDHDGVRKEGGLGSCGTAQRALNQYANLSSRSVFSVRVHCLRSGAGGMS